MEAPCLITYLKTQSAIKYDKNIAEIPNQVIEYDESQN